MQNPDSQLGELAVLNELAQVGKGLLLRVRNELDEVEHTLDDGALEVVATLITQDTAQESQHTGLLAGELEAKRADSLDDRDLELVGDLRHEAGDLLHEAIDAGLVSGLEESGDGKGGDRSVAVGDEELDVGVADVNGVGLEGGEVVEDAEGGELGDGTRRRKEELEDVNSVGDLSVSHIPHVADSLGGLEVDHFTLVAEPAVKKLHHGLAQRCVLLSQLSGQPHEHDESSRALDRSRSAKLLDHLDQCHAIV